MTSLYSDIDLNFGINPLTKDITKKRNTGYLCANSGKKVMLLTLNQIYGEDKFNKENTKSLVDQELCIYQNIILRHYQKINKNSKMWFFDFELSNIYNI